jgi:mannose/fructose/N-acetylgalactosamine-specific phosphotransferase system component IIB
VLAVNDKVRDDVLKIVKKLREDSIPTDYDLRFRTLSKQLEYANSLKVRYVAIVGEKELKEKIRKIVLGMAAEISKKFNCQTYLLTEFWEYVRDANPVIFTLLRDGVPLIDKGLFAPWRLLLRMGRIKPTRYPRSWLRA